MSTLRIRQAVAADRDWILSHAPRLHEFGPPPLRSLDVMDAAVARSIAETLDKPSVTAVVLVAEDGDTGPLGFVHMITENDFFTAEPHGHVSDLVVDRGAEGRGIGRALLEAGEQWSMGCGHRFVTLNVFQANTRAWSMYERAGYVAEITKFVKELGARF